MIAGSAAEQKSLETQHKVKMKNTQDRHKNDLDRLKNNHNNNMTKLRNNNLAQLNDIKSQNEIKVIQQTKTNEERLIKIKDSIEVVKNQTNKEKNNIIKMHDNKKETEKKLFELQYNQNKEKHQMIIEDLNHEANMDLQKTIQKNKTQKREVDGTNSDQKEFMKNSHLTEMHMKKEEFTQKKTSAKGKFTRDLAHQTKNHKKTLTTNEREHNTEVLKRKKRYDGQTTRIENYGQNRNLQMQARYEEKYKENFSHHEKQLQHLGKHKERIINNIKGQLKQDLVLEMKKDKDPFYKNLKLQPNLAENEKKDGYTLTIKMPEHEAKKVNLTGANRDLRLSMARDYNFTKKEADGTINTIKKSESIVSKLNVEKIIDGNTIKRSYKEGFLTFKIGLA